MKPKIPYIEFFQNKQQFLVASMTFDCIDTFSKVLVYDRDQGGYQRKPEPKHFNKIRDYILSNRTKFILPTSIVLGLDKNVFDIISKEKGFLNLELIKQKDPVFRIVDGQHRIAGLHEAAIKDSSIKEIKLPVVIVVTSNNHRSTELEIFNDINSKAKRVKVDLIKLATFDYRIREENINNDNIVEHICTKVAFLLKEQSEGSVWSNAIKFDIHREGALGIIGVNSFMESIDSIVKVYLKNNPIDFLKLKHDAVIKKVNSSSEAIAKFISKAWNELIKTKWPDTFGSHQLEMDTDDELKLYYYKKDYYIQKTFAVKALNGLLGDYYKTRNGDEKRTLDDFKKKLTASNIRNEDWKIGGQLSGLSSESGVKKLKEMI